MIAGILSLVAACTEDTEPVNDGSVMEVAGVTRADEDLMLTDPVNTEGTKIKVFLTTNDNSQTRKTTGLLTCLANSHWKSTLSITENIQYYLYGFMPADAAATSDVTADDDDYSKGVNMTLGGLPVLSDQDVCAIVGVQHVESAATPKTPWPEGYESSFGFLAGAPNHNYADLLMEHLYASLEFKFNVDAAYAGLRTIHLKEVTLQSKYSTLDVTVTLRAISGIRAVAYNSFAGGERTIELQKNSDPEVVLPVAPATTPVGAVLYAPSELFDQDGTNVSVVCKYDVYDNNVTSQHPNGNLIRENCTATNKLKYTSDRPMIRGKKKVLTLTVNPTYLHVLSEPDLDNPTITVN